MRTLIYVVILLSMLFGLSLPMLAAQENVTYINPRTVGEAGGPFSGSVLAGNTLYISGTLGLDENGEVPTEVAVDCLLYTSDAADE